MFKPLDHDHSWRALFAFAFKHSHAFKFSLISLLHLFRPTWARRRLRERIDTFCTSIKTRFGINWITHVKSAKTEVGHLCHFSPVSSNSIILRTVLFIPWLGDSFTNLKSNSISKHSFCILSIFLFHCHRKHRPNNS